MCDIRPSKGYVTCDAAAKNPALHPRPYVFAVREIASCSASVGLAFHGIGIAQCSYARVRGLAPLRVERTP